MSPADAMASAEVLPSRAHAGEKPVSFRAFRQLNDPELAWLPGLSSRIHPGWSCHFASDGLPDRLVRALAERRALPVKEVVESFEFFERVRKKVRSSVMVDLCCGHGLTGLLFAVFERKVERVVLLDRKRPPSHDAILDALLDVAPWAVDKVSFEEHTMAHAAPRIPQEAGLVAVHACGKYTDQSLALGMERRCRIAVMPCCYYQTGRNAPEALHRALGRALTTDIDRTYRLERAGYRVDWSAIPSLVTPMNRILIGRPGPGTGSATDA